MVVLIPRSIQLFDSIRMNLKSVDQLGCSIKRFFCTFYIERFSDWPQTQLFKNCGEERMVHANLLAGYTLVVLWRSSTLCPERDERLALRFIFRPLSVIKMKLKNENQKKYYIVTFLCLNGILFGGGIALFFPKIFNAILNSVRKKKAPISPFFSSTWFYLRKWRW